MISPQQGRFLGVWNWDSAFHAIGMLDFDIEIAKEQILVFLQFQKEDGLLPDVICERGEIEDNFSKPPVMAYAAYFAAKGLKNYGFNETAQTIKDTILEWVSKDGDNIHENYNSLTGEGQNNKRFSWSCVFAHEFLMNF